ncbi:unnamed protein product [Diabrotica balteata]|uniref:Uncharacterized protein n=1 Tax=Diabrotica balteata TaxID=107213 RepID=A0A9N9X8Q2_DIABA|nr:unnamed protein product [Diabrotica balteata]
MTSSTVFLFILLSMVYLFVETAARQDCGPHYCLTRKHNCDIALCTDDYVEMDYPELCRCCPQCYKIKGDGESCGEENFAVCGPNLKCVRGVCIKNKI